MEHQSYKQMRRRRFLREYFTSPPILLYLALTVAGVWLVPAYVYWSLRTCLITPNGGIAWFLTVLGSVALLGCIGHIVWSTKQRGKLAVLGIRPRRPFWPLLGVLFFSQFLIGPTVALASWSTMQQDVIVPAGKGKISTLKPEMQLRQVLKSIEKRGIFTWMTHS